MSQVNVSIGIHGALGRMGTRLIQLIAEDPGLTLAAALERDGHPRLGDDVGVLTGIAPLGIALSSIVPTKAAIDVDDRLLVAAGGPGDRGLVQGTERPAGGGDHRVRHGPAPGSRVSIGPYPDPDLAQHEPGGEPLDETGRRGRARSGSDGRHRDHRAASSHEEGRAERNGLAAGGLCRRGAPRRARFVEGHPGRTDVRSDGRNRHPRPAYRRLAGRAYCRLRTDGGNAGAEPSRPESGRIRGGALDAAKFLAGKPVGLYSMEHVLG